MSRLASIALMTTLALRSFTTRTHCPCDPQSTSQVLKWLGAGFVRRVRIGLDLNTRIRVGDSIRDFQSIISPARFSGFHWCEITEI